MAAEEAAAAEAAAAEEAAAVGDSLADADVGAPAAAHAAAPLHVTTTNKRRSAAVFRKKLHNGGQVKNEHPIASEKKEPKSDTRRRSTKKRVVGRPGGAGVIDSLIDLERKGFNGAWRHGQWVVGGGVFFCFFRFFGLLGPFETRPVRPVRGGHRLQGQQREAVQFGGHQSAHQQRTGRRRRRRDAVETDHGVATPLLVLGGAAEGGARHPRAACAQLGGDEKNKTKEQRVAASNDGQRLASRRSLPAFLYKNPTEGAGLARKRGGVSAVLFF